MISGVAGLLQLSAEVVAAVVLKLRMAKVLGRPRPAKLISRVIVEMARRPPRCSSALPKLLALKALKITPVTLPPEAWQPERRLRLVQRGPAHELPSSNDPFGWVDELGVEATDYR